MPFLVAFSFFIAGFVNYTNEWITLDGIKNKYFKMLTHAVGVNVYAKEKSYERDKEDKSKSDRDVSVETSVQSVCSLLNVTSSIQ